MPRVRLAASLIRDGRVGPMPFHFFNRLGGLASAAGLRPSPCRFSPRFSWWSGARPRRRPLDIEVRDGRLALRPPSGGQSTESDGARPNCRC